MPRYLSLVRIDESNLPAEGPSPELMQRMGELLEEIISRHSGQPIEKVRKDIERDKILTAEDAKAYGLVDDVFVSRKRRPAVVSP